MSLDQLLSESVLDAEQREITEFPRAFAASGGKIVLVGAGNLGRKIKEALARSQFDRVVAFADNDPKLQGAILGGAHILSWQDSIQRYSEEALYIVCIFSGTGDGGMARRLAALREHGCKHVITFLPVAWYLSARLLPHYAAAQPSSILRERSHLYKVAGFWSDVVSRQIFFEQLSWRLRADFSLSRLPSDDQYHPRDVFQLGISERIIDAGAFDGDTLRELSSHFEKAWAIEPDPANAARLRTFDDHRVEVLECALDRTARTAKFDGHGEVSSKLAAQGNVEVAVKSLDSLGIVGATYLKLDIEGAEVGALAGGEKLLRRDRPIVAACLYHRPEDLWTIPLLLRASLPEHRFFLRNHQYDGFELVMYAVPVNRCL